MIKTFNQFSKDLVFEARNVENITQITPSAGEIAAWKVVLKAGSQNLDDKQPVPQIIDALSRDENFIKWWTSKEYVNVPNGTVMPTALAQQILPHNLVAFSRYLSRKEKNLFGKEVAKFEIGFKAIAWLPGAGNKVNFVYDLNKATPVAAVKVGDYNLFVYSSEDESKMKLENTMTSIEPSDFDKVSPAAVMKSLKGKTSTSDQTASTTTAAPAATSGTATTGATAAGSKYVGLKKDTHTKNDTVKDLQTMILASGNADAIAQMGGYGADGYYGDKTALAIGKLLGQGAVDSIDQATDAKLNAIFSKITPEQIKAVKDKATAPKPAASKPAASTQTAKSSGSTIQTKKGTLTFA